MIKGRAPLPVVLTTSEGNVLRAFTTYGIGVYGSALLMARILRMDANERRRAEQFFARYGCWSLLLSWLPG